MAGYEANSDYQTEQILDHLSTGVLVFDTRLRLVSLNTAGEILLGQSARHAHGKTPMEILVNGSQMVDQLQRAMASGDMILNRGCRYQIIGRVIRTQFRFNGISFDNDDGFIL